LDYLINKTEAYRCHLGTLCIIPEVFRATIQAFTELDAGRLSSCRTGIAQAVAGAWRAERNAIDATRRFAACGDHPSDLAVTWMVQHIVTGTRVLRQYLGNIHAYHEGRDYWGEIDWPLFFGTSPFPTYTLEGADTLMFG
jgi:hypothetical protein